MTVLTLATLWFSLALAVGLLLGRAVRLRDRVVFVPVVPSVPQRREERLRLLV